MRSTITGDCYACGADAVAHVRYKGRKLLGCNRCASRHRQGGDFMRPYANRLRLRETLLPRIRRMRAKGKSDLEIGNALGLTSRTVRRWVDGA